MIRAGGWRAWLINTLGMAAIAAATLAPTATSGPAPAVGRMQAPAFGLTPVAVPGATTRGAAQLTGATASPAGVSGITAPGAAQLAGATETGAPIPAGPVHVAPLARHTAVQTPVLAAAPAPPSTTSQQILAAASSAPLIASQPSLAAVDGLDVATDTTYVVDPSARVVRVAVDLTAVNRLPVTPGARYYYPGVNLAVQLEARQFVADEGGTRDRTATQARSGYRLLTVQFAARLYIGQTAHLHVAYVLPAGAPRSSSQVRVGAAYTTFVAWAFGDGGAVEVDVPPQFSVDVSGDAMEQGTSAGGQRILTASASDPGSWYAWIDARDDNALTTRPLTLAGGEQVVVRAWPEDPTWEKAVSRTLTTAIPALAKRIGLPWPVSGQLSVLEVSGALLEGYAGFYSPGKQQITISEAVDPPTVVHEASHAWFNSSLFSERWITEGLADEYAYRALTGLGVAVDGPRKVRANASVAFALDTWGTPAPIKTRTQDAREQWGYDASWTVVRGVVTKLGETKMAAVFAAASAGTTAYSAASPPEKSTRPADWRRFVDLAEEVGGGRGIAELISPWVLTPPERALIAPRATARSAYHDLLAKDGDWAAPVVVRMDLDAWDFTGASSAIADATAVLKVRDGIRIEAAAEHLAIPSALASAYQTASSPEALMRAADDEQALRRSLDAVLAADAALRAPRDWLVTLGLVGQDPSGALVSARAAWTAGDTSTAAEEAASARAALAVAGDAGKLRLVAIGAGIVALALLLMLAVTIVRRRSSRGGRPSVVAAAALASAGAAWAIHGSGETSASDVPPAAPLPVAPPPNAVPDTAPDAALDTAPAPAVDWIDPRLAPPPPPPWWRPSVPPEPPVQPGPYPILPANAAARPTSRSWADRDDEGAQ